MALNGLRSLSLLSLVNTAVGFVQGIFGLSTAALALPVGILSDKTARHVVAKLSAVLDVAGIALIAAGILSQHGQYYILCAAAAVWGLSTACDANTDALFADSVAAADRSVQFTQLQAFYMLSIGVGTLLAAAIFRQQGNEWSLQQLGLVMLCGMAAQIVPVYLKLLIHDKYTLGAESEAYATATSGQTIRTATQDPTEPAHTATLPPPPSGAQLQADYTASTHQPERTPRGDDDVCEPLLPHNAWEPAVEAVQTQTQEDQEGAQVAGASADNAPVVSDAWACKSGRCESVNRPITPRARARLVPWAWWPDKLVLSPGWVPWMVFLSDLMMGVASGMTVNFFPIFFMEEALLTPMSTSLLFATLPLCISAATLSAQRLAAGVGRVPATLCLRWLGVALQLLMALAPGLWPIPPAIIPIYLTRAAFANGTSALTRAILMDFVPKELRGRWSSLDGFTAFGWSGSAVVGGVLLDRHGFAAVFALTAGLQLVASLFVVALLPVVPRHEAAAAAAPAMNAAEDDAGSAGFTVADARPVDATVIVSAAPAP